MKRSKDFELPDHLKDEQQNAKRLEYWTIAFLISVVIIMYLVMGSSQAMKTAWIEDMLGLIAPISFLIASKMAIKKPSAKYPYGFHRAHSISFLIGAVALSTIGTFLVYDAITALLKREHPTINSIEIWGHTVWMGWLMIAALIYSAIPAFILGKKKLPLSTKLHNKLLYTDAKTNKADYLTAGAAAIGILGIGFGLWWADAAAALIISVDIVNDGYRQLKASVSDLMNSTPTTVDGDDRDPLVDKVRDLLNSLDWVKEAQVRFREDGQVYFGEAIVVPKDQNSDLHDEMNDAQEKIHALDWRIYDLIISPAKFIPDEHRDEWDEGQ